MTLPEKKKNLEDQLRELGRVVVAFSGGVDSSLLLKLAAEVLGTANVLAVIASSPTYPGREKNSAMGFCADNRIHYVVIETDEMADEAFVANTEKRCYHCKTHLYNEMRVLAREKGFPFIIEGSNIDDLADYRPGRTALQEQGILSPFVAAGITKAEIRELSKQLGLPVHDKPSKACLASRVPYGTKIDTEMLKMIDSAEEYLEKQGFTQVRVRCHNGTARIELLPEEMQKALDMKDVIVDAFTELGFVYVSLDMKGYRTGSMNEMLVSTGDIDI